MNPIKMAYRNHKGTLEDDTSWGVCPGKHCATVQGFLWLGESDTIEGAVEKFKAAVDRLIEENLKGAT